MSDIEKQFEETFEDSKGLPAVENKKQLERKKKEKEKILSGLTKTFYTLRNGKYLKLIAKHNGCHSIYIGREKKISKEEQALMVKRWVAAGEFLHPHEVDQKISSVIQELKEKYTEALAKKKK